MSSDFFLVLLESHLNMDSSAIFASPFLSLVFKGFEFLEPSDLMSPWQTVRKSTARSLQSSVSQSCLRAILTPHWRYPTGLPTYLTYSFLVFPSPSPHSFSWHPAPPCKWKSHSLLLKISSRAIAPQGGITKAKRLHLHDASRLGLCQPLHTSTYYTPTLLDAPSFGYSSGQSFFSFTPCSCLWIPPGTPFPWTSAWHASHQSTAGLSTKKAPGGPPCPQTKQATPPPPPFQHVYLSFHLFPHLELSN